MMDLFILGSYLNISECWGCDNLLKIAGFLTDMGDYSDTTVVIPTFNEGGNIKEMLDLLIELYPKISVIVSDDGSKDDTQKIVLQYGKKNKKIKLLDRGKEPVHGLTISVVDAGLIVKTKFFVVIDGDLQHPPEKIAEIIEGLRQGNDVVVGAREKVISEWPWHRKLMSWGANMLGKIRLSLGRAPFVKDPVSGFFGTRTDLFQQVANASKNRFEFKGYKVLFDYLKLLSRDKLVGEVLYDFGLRERGESKIKLKHVLLYLKSLFK